MSQKKPKLSQARAPLVREVTVVNEFGHSEAINIPAERALTVYVDKRELVTLMTLGGFPEWLVLGYLRNQRLVQTIEEIESITVDWAVGAAAVKTRAGISHIEERTAKKTITTGCGQGSVFGDLMADIDKIKLPEGHITQTHLYDIVNTIRLQDSIYKSAGSVHGCALFRGGERLVFVEDVGRHNAIDTIAGWMWLQNPTDMQGDDKTFYTTGRLTSEMVIKAAQMQIPIVVSRSGITEMGLQVANQLGLCTIGRATNKRFFCFSAPHRLVLEPDLAKANLTHSASELNTVTAVVLAGGRGSRMGGADKGLQPFNGASLAFNALSRLQIQVGGPLGGVMINANRNIAQYESLGVPVWQDTLADYAGPLAGFLTGMQRSQTPYLLTVPCDTPLFPLDLAQRMMRALKAESATMAIAQSCEDTQLHHQPVFALMSCALLDSLMTFTQAGGRKIMAWAQQQKIVYVPFNQPKDNLKAFYNANTLEELHALENQ